jgi:hypothetical protein
MAYSPQDVYARHLVSRRGYPLWTPEPSMDLPDSYVREGLKIGDVGVVVPEDGSFDVFFNVCLPPEHSLHRETGVPDNFTPFYSVEGISPSFPKPRVQVVSFRLPQWQGWVTQMHLMKIQKGTTWSLHDHATCLY